MGTWDVGPFNDDTAADFADSLDEARPDEREGLIRGALDRTLTATDYLHEAQEAVAAAALIASQCPTGQPVDSGYGPRSAIPELLQDLRMLADEVLARCTDDSGLVESWVYAGDDTRWLAMIRDLRRVLNPPPPTIDVPLFDLDGQPHRSPSSAGRAGIADAQWATFGSVDRIADSGSGLARLAACRRPVRR